MLWPTENLLKLLLFTYSLFVSHFHTLQIFVNATLNIVSIIHDIHVIQESESVAHFSMLTFATLEHDK